MGWEIWSLRRAFWRNETPGDLEKRRARTVMPVPPGTARHQLSSVAPTARDWGSADCEESDIAVLVEVGLECERE